MDNILRKLTDLTRIRISRDMREVPLHELKSRIAQRQEKEAERGRPLPDFLEALKRPGMSYICEVKKASPSKGLISPDFPYMDIALEYEAAGASAISCLTEPFMFQGKDRYVEEISDRVSIPVLRKDFTISEYMIYQARSMGASAVLLICAILSKRQLKDYLALTAELGMHALVEAHDEDELRSAVDAGAEIIGVNNRDLRTFTVDTSNSIALRSLAPADKVFVSESGIRTHHDIQKLYDNGVNAVLIGETLMRSNDRRATLEQLNGAPLKQ